MKVAFFHGLESPAISDKSEYLQSAFPDAYVPAMDYNKAGLFDEVLKEVKKKNIDLLVGSSMGGWFAYCISTLTGIPTILFNPAVHSRSVEPGVYRGSSRANHTVVLGKSDDLIDPQKTKNWFKTVGVGSVNYKMESNGHRTPIGIFRKYVSAYESQSSQSHVMLFEQWLLEAESRTPRKPGQPAGSSKHSDLYTDEDPEGTIHGLGFKDAETAEKGVEIIKKIDREHAHKVQAALVMQQRGKVAIERTQDPEKKKNLKAANVIWTDFLEELKKKTQEKNK